MNIPVPRLVPITVAARHLRLKADWLKAEAAAGRVPCLRAGKQILCDVEAVETALLEQARRLSPIADSLLEEPPESRPENLLDGQPSASRDDLLDDQTPGNPPEAPGEGREGPGDPPGDPGDGPEDPRGLAGEKHRENTEKSPRSTFSKKDRKKGQSGFDHDAKSY
jgi:hypothetical protein